MTNQLISRRCKSRASRSNRSLRFFWIAALEQLATVGLAAGAALPVPLPAALLPQAASTAVVATAAITGSIRRIGEPPLVGAGSDSPKRAEAGQPTGPLQAAHDPLASFATAAGRRAGGVRGRAAVR